MAPRLLLPAGMIPARTPARLAILGLVSGCILTDPRDELTSTGLDDAADSAASSSGVDPASESDAGTDDANATDDGLDTSGDAGTDAGDETGDDALRSASAIGIAVGRLHACALVDGGAVRCWGYGDHGQVGNGAPLGDVAVRVPEQVSGLESGVTAITSHFDHTCAITGAGEASCWGANGSGQLGDGSVEDSSTPVAVVGLAGVERIDAGVDHTCAIASGGAWCWGKNDYGQLGNGSEDAESAMPVEVVGLSSGVVAIAAGRYHSCAVTDQGAVLCWGGDVYGELGDGDPLSASSVPVPVVGMSAGMVDVAASDSVTCALGDGGAAHCWGKNDDGQLGNGESGTLVESHEPTDVVGLVADVQSISPSYGYSCAVAAGAVQCWGDNLDGTLGNGEGPGFQSPVPVGVVGLGEGGAEVGAGATLACARTDAGAVLCWGSNDGGGLGDGSEDSSNVPVAVVSLP